MARKSPRPKVVPLPRKKVMVVKSSSSPFSNSGRTSREFEKNLMVFLRSVRAGFRYSIGGGVLHFPVAALVPLAFSLFDPRARDRFPAILNYDGL
jgi:hypothetical protein